MRVALEVTADTQVAAINTDSDNDGFSDLLESRIGSDANDDNSPYLHNPPASERQFSSTENTAAIGDDGADGQIDANAWRPAAQDSAPWTTLSVPAGSKLVGAALQGDPSTNRWVSALLYADTSVVGLRSALFDGDPQYANTDASSTLNQWLIDHKDVRSLRIEPQTWENGAGMRVGLWVIDTVSTVNEDPLLSDIDGDGLNTLQEMAFGLDSQYGDTDSDGLSDGAEIAFGTNPSTDDTDHDGLNDHTELLFGSDPGDNSSPGVGNTKTQTTTA